MDGRPGGTIQTAVTWLSLASSLVAIGFLFGEVRGDVERNTSDIEQIKADNRDLDKKITDIWGDTREIKERLRWLTGGAKEDGQ